MKTNTHPGDYDLYVPIVPRLEPLCANCGGFMLPPLIGNEARRCANCGGTDSALVLESDAAEFRASLRRADTARAELDAASLAREAAQLSEYPEGPLDPRSPTQAPDVGFGPGGRPM